MNAVWLKFLPQFLRDRLDGRHHLQQAMGNTGWLLADKVLRYGLGLFVGIAVARYLGPSDLGKLSYVSALVIMVASLSTIGLDDVVVQKLVRETVLTKEILGTTFLLKLLSAILGMFILLVAVRVMRPGDEDAQMMALLMGAALLFQPIDVVDYFFQSKIQSQYVVIARATAFVMVSALKVGMIFVGATLIYFAGAYTVEALIGGCLLWGSYNTCERDGLHWRWDRRLAKELLHVSWPVALSGTLVGFTLNIDKVLLGEFRGIHDVGLYAVASQLSFMWNVFPVVAGASLAPLLTKMHSINVEAYKARLQQVYNLLTWVSVSVAALVSFFAQDITILLFGSKYSGAGDILAVNVWSTVFIFHVSMRSRAFLIEGRQKYIAIFAGGTLLANILLNLALIPLYGAIGSAFASVLCWLICAGVLSLLWPDTRPSAYMFFSSFIPRVK